MSVSTPDQFLEPANDFAASRVDADVASSRRLLLQYSGMVLRNLLAAEIINAEEGQPGENQDRWVAVDGVSIPGMQKGIGRTCLTFMVEGRNLLSDQTERLQVSMPRPEGFDTEDLERLHELGEPEAVFIERARPPEAEGGDPEIISRYAVMPERSYKYDVDGIEIVEAYDEGSFEEFFMRRRTNELARISLMRLDMLNFGVVPQGVRTVFGRSGSESI
jgi:hypothetical protein